MILLTCDQCDKSLRLRDELAGKRIKCPGCGGTLAVPFPEDDEVSPPPRAKAPAPVRAGKPTKPVRPRDDEDEEDERPIRKSKSDDAGPAKPHTIFLILGLLLGLGGLIAMCFFIWLAKTANDNLNVRIRDKQHELKVKRDLYETHKANGFEKQAEEKKTEIDRLDSEIQNMSSSEVTTNSIIAAGFGLVFLLGVIIRGYHFVKMKKWHAANPSGGKKKKKRRDDDDDDD